MMTKGLGGGGGRHNHLRELQLFLQDWADQLNWYYVSDDQDTGQTTIGSVWGHLLSCSVEIFCLLLFLFLVKTFFELDVIFGDPLTCLFNCTIAKARRRREREGRRGRSRSPSRGGKDERRRSLLLESWSSDEETEDGDDEDEGSEDLREEDAKAWEEEDESDSGYGKESAPQRDSGYIEDQFSSTARSD